MFAVGHFALAYLLGKTSGKLLNVKLHIPLIMVLSIIPDIDILFESFIADIHRGPTHSIVMATLLSIPSFVFYGKKAVPYFIALASHSLVGDFIIGGQIQLFWPFTTNEFGFPYIDIRNPINIALEFTLFVITLTALLKTCDLFHFCRNSKLNLILIISISTVLLPTFTGYPLRVPILLVLPHLFYLVLFSISVLIVTIQLLK